MAITAPQPFIDPLLETMTLNSDINGAAYEIRIALPLSYRHTDKAYPVMVVLDAEFTFYLATETARTEAMWSQAPLKGAPAAIPEFIVASVALPGSPPDPFRRNFEYMPQVEVEEMSERARGYIERIEAMLGSAPRFGGAATFQRVLAEEMLPALADAYRVDPGLRMLVGQSASGCFAAFNLLTRPDLFTDYVIISPGPAEEIFRLEKAWAASHDDLAARVLVSVGEREEDDPLEIFDNAQRLWKDLAGRGYPGLDLERWIIPGADHVKTAGPSLARALSRLGGIGG